MQNITVNGPAVYFISDAHFGIDLPGYENRENLFFRFLDREKSKINELYILGDLFDFWIEYRHALRPDYFNVLHHLKQLTEQGTHIHYLAGNHDFALGPFLKNAIGITTYPAAVSCTIQGKRVYLYHGDGLISHDIGYRIVKKLLRSSINQRIYKLLHPNIGVPLGSFVSGSSRKYLNKPLDEKIRKQYDSRAREWLQKGHDIVFFGHIHQPEFINYPEGIYCNTGAWLKHLTYATMCSGEVSLCRFNPGGSDERIPYSEAK